jgi:hypothetical protein
MTYVNGGHITDVEFPVQILSEPKRVADATLTVRLINLVPLLFKALRTAIGVSGCK